MQLTQKKLRKLYYSMSNKELCKKLGVTNPTLMKYLKTAGIPLKGMGNRTKRTKVVIVNRDEK